ncbi:MAG TPA: hypothetical protein VL181_01120 [Holophagaceae bacterium]|nr:hypothetical protein [Holophagaceae bacterium]
MRTRKLPHLPLAGLLILCIPQPARGEMPQGRGRRPVPGSMRLESSPADPGQRAGEAPANRPGRPSLPAAPPGRPPVLRPSYTRLGTTATFAYLPVFNRCTILPTAAYWRDRDYDIMAAIQREARKGFIPVTPFPVDQDTVMGTSMVASGWRAYGFVVPPGGQLRLKLSHPKPGWFRVYWVDQWGEYRPGMMVKPGEPEALYLNQGKKPMAVYAIVDDPGQWATNAASAFTLTATRNFDAAHMDAGGVTVHQGIWNTAPESYWMSAAHP